MVFSAAGFHRVPHVGGGISHYVYKTTGDTLKTVASATAPTYFAYARDSTGNINPLSTDDMFFIMASDAKGWFKVSSVSTTSAPYSTAVGLIGVSPVLAESIAYSTGALPPYGFVLSTVASGGASILDMPWYAGQEVTLLATVSTSWTVTFSSTAAGSISATGTQVLLNALGQAVTLIAMSTAKWMPKSMAQQSATAIIGPVIS